MNTVIVDALRPPLSRGPLRFLITLLGIALFLVSTETLCEDLPSQGPRACAHRGDVEAAPENTLPALVSAVEKGAHQIEFDLRLTRDGRLVLMHDEAVDRTTDGSGKVTDLTFEEVRSLDAGSWFSERFAGTQVPTFEEALEVIPPVHLCNVHLKGTPEVAEKAARVLVERNRLDHCFLAATIEQASAAKAVAPTIRICNMSRQAGPDTSYPEETIRLGCEYIQLLGSKQNLKETVKNLHENNVLVNFYFGNTRQEIEELAGAGVDFILTDHLDLCLEVLQKYGTRPVGK
jgi:glycerophosphoryl diester phosphodiesterase